MKFTHLNDLPVSGKRVLLRVDFNVPLAPDGTVSDNGRIRAALSTIELLREKGARLILMSHLGRPRGERVEKLSLIPVRAELERLLGVPVRLAPDCVGRAVKEEVEALKEGEVLLLENLRFHAGETANDPAFARELAALGEAYVNDAFGTAHRAHASTRGVPELMALKAPGLLMEKELEILGSLLENPRRPFTAVLGGAKIAGKIPVIRNLLPRVDRLLIGGGMMFTFLKAQGLDVGKSLLDREHLDLAQELVTEAQQHNVALVLPVDTVTTISLESPAEVREVDVKTIGPEEMGVDIGPRTRELFSRLLQDSATIFWNGPMGIFEKSEFAEGTLAVARALSEATARGASTVVGGGDSAAAVRQGGFARKVTHISTGGGASLEFMEGKTLPGVEILLHS